MLTEFSSIIELIQKFPDEQSCIDHLETIRWNGHVISPFNPDSKVYKCAGNKYKCKETGKYFNVRTATIFEDTKMPLQKWFMALYIFSSHKKGISSHQLAKDLNITQKSAWFVLHRLRYAFDHPAFKAQLSNVVEVDETYVGGSDLNKHASKKNKALENPKRFKGKAPVVGMVERGGNVIVQQVEDNHSDTLEFVVTKNVSQEATLVSDQWRGYDKMEQYYDMKRIDHSAKQYVDGMAHTNTIEGFWSQLKRGIDGIYHWVSVKHLHSYAQEFSLRYNSRKFNENQRFNLILANMAGRLTYTQLIKK
jgi:hypothetical protein